MFRLACRQAEGLLGSIVVLLGLSLRVPDHTTLSRRAATLHVPRPGNAGAGAGSKPMHLLVDSTGLKLCGKSGTRQGSARADEQAWLDHLDALGLTGLEVMPDPLRVATEGALWGAVSAHGFLCDAVVVSDDAGQFDIGTHALCWIHAERLMHKLEPVTDQQRCAQQHVRGLIWWFYADLKAYRVDPMPRRCSEMRTRFDRIFRRRTGFATLDRLLKRQHAIKAELLRVLNHPEMPLHTNGSENDIRCQVAKRVVSGAPAATPDAIAVTPSWVWPRHAASSASSSGAISAPGSASTALPP